MTPPSTQEQTNGSGTATKPQEVAHQPDQTKVDDQNDNHSMNDNECADDSHVSQKAETKADELQKKSDGSGDEE